MMGIVSVEVIHPKLMFSVNGKLQHVPIGTKLKVTKEAAEKIISSGKGRALGGRGSVTVGQVRDIDVADSDKK